MIHPEYYAPDVFSREVIGGVGTECINFVTCTRISHMYYRLYSTCIIQRYLNNTYTN